MDSDFKDVKRHLESISQDVNVDFYDAGLLKIIEKEKVLMFGREKTSDSKRREKIGWVVDDLFDDYYEVLNDDIEKY